MIWHYWPFLTLSYNIILDWDLKCILCNDILDLLLQIYKNLQPKISISDFIGYRITRKSKVRTNIFRHKIFDYFELANIKYYIATNDRKYADDIQYWLCWHMHYLYCHFYDVTFIEQSFFTGIYLSWLLRYTVYIGYYTIQI